MKVNFNISEILYPKQCCPYEMATFSMGTAVQMKWMYFTWLQLKRQKLKLSQQVPINTVMKKRDGPGTDKLIRKGIRLKYFYCQVQYRFESVLLDHFSLIHVHM